jgi:hypothetical protein
MRRSRKTGVCLILLEHVFGWVRQENPAQPLTVGLWTGEWVGPRADRLTEFKSEADFIKSLTTGTPPR